MLSTHPFSFGFFRYVACWLYEALLILAYSMVVAAMFYTLFGDATQPPKLYVMRAVLWIAVGAYFVYHWKKGATLAMTTWRLNVESRSHTPVTYPQAALRYAVGSLLFGLTVMWAFFDREGLFLHDRLAGTRLVYRPKSPPSKPSSSL